MSHSLKDSMSPLRRSSITQALQLVDLEDGRGPGAALPVRGNALAAVNEGRAVVSLNDNKAPHFRGALTAYTAATNVIAQLLT